MTAGAWLVLAFLLVMTAIELVARWWNRRVARASRDLAGEPTRKRVGL